MSLVENEEQANYIIEYSKKIVDSIYEKRIDKLSKRDLSKQYIVFAGMLSYYGFEYINTIYKSFDTTKFYYTKLPVIQEIEKQHVPVSNEELSNLKKEEMIGELNLQMITSENFPSLPEKKQYIIVTTEKSRDSAEILERIVHEQNHVVNSIEKGVFLKGGTIHNRSGLIADIEGGYPIETAFEEGINSLQTEEIMIEILKLSGYKVFVPLISSALESFTTTSKEEFKIMGYQNVVEYIRPLYENEKYNYLFKKSRVEGTIEDIHLSMPKGVYVELVTNVNLLAEENCAKRIAEHNVKTLINKCIKK